MVDVKCDICKDVISSHEYCSEADKEYQHHENIHCSKDILVIATDARHICNRCRSVADSIDWNYVVRKAMKSKGVTTAVAYEDIPIQEGVTDGNN